MRNKRDIGVKVCPRCKESKSFDLFNKNKSRKDGLAVWCRLCEKENRDSHKETFSAYQKKTRSKHLEQRRKDSRDYYYRNRESILEKHRTSADIKEKHNQWRKSPEGKATLAKYAIENADKIKEAQKEHYRKNKETISAYHKQRYLDKKDYILQQNREYRKRNPEVGRRAASRRRALTYSACVEGEVTPSVSLVRERDGDKCFYCEVVLDFTKRSTTPLPTMAELEHKMPLSRGGLHIMENVVLSCVECNRKKYTKTHKEFVGLQKNKK